MISFTLHISIQFIDQKEKNQLHIQKNFNWVQYYTVASIIELPFWQLVYMHLLIFIFPPSHTEQRRVVYYTWSAAFSFVCDLFLSLPYLVYRQVVI